MLKKTGRKTPLKRVNIEPKIVIKNDLWFVIIFNYRKHKAKKHSI